MKARHLILLLLHNLGGAIDSKTKLQKEIYVISLLLGKELGFRAHHYGPDCVEVEQGIDELIGAGFLDVKRNVHGVGSEQGFEIKRYDFSVTESGSKLAKILTEENDTENSRIRDFTEKLKDVRNIDYLRLSIAAKAYFVLKKEGKPMTADQIRERSERFGWTVGEDDIQVAIDILRKLDFIKGQ